MKGAILLEKKTRRGFRKEAKRVRDAVKLIVNKTDSLVKINKQESKKFYGQDDENDDFVINARQ